MCMYVYMWMSVLGFMCTYIRMYIPSRGPKNALTLAVSPHVHNDVLKRHGKFDRHVLSRQHGVAWRGSARRHSSISRLTNTNYTSIRRVLPNKDRQPNLFV